MCAANKTELRGTQSEQVSFVPEEEHKYER